MPISSGANRWPKSYWTGRPVPQPPTIHSRSLSVVVERSVRGFKERTVSMPAGAMRRIGSVDCGSPVDGSGGSPTTAGGPGSGSVTSPSLRSPSFPCTSSAMFSRPMSSTDGGRAERTCAASIAAVRSAGSGPDRRRSGSVQASTSGGLRMEDIVGRSMRKVDPINVESLECEEQCCELDQQKKEYEAYRAQLLQRRRKLFTLGLVVSASTVFILVLLSVSLGVSMQPSEEVDLRIYFNQLSLLVVSDAVPEVRRRAIRIIPPAPCRFNDTILAAAAAAAVAGGGQPVTARHSTFAMA